MLAWIKYVSQWTVNVLANPHPPDVIYCTTRHLQLCSIGLRERSPRCDGVQAEVVGPEVPEEAEALWRSQTSNLSMFDLVF